MFADAHESSLVSRMFNPAAAGARASAANAAIDPNMGATTRGCVWGDEVSGGSLLSSHNLYGGEDPAYASRMEVPGVTPSDATRMGVPKLAKVGGGWEARATHVRRECMREASHEDPNSILGWRMSW
jgi:hypothetical protein